MKKVLLVGHFGTNPDIYTYAQSFYKTLNHLGYSTIKFEYRQKLVPIKVINNFLINKKLIFLTKKLKPDIIFCIKAEIITSKTINKIKKTQNPLLINFYPDNPFTFWNGNSNAHVLNSLPLYNHFLIWGQELMPVLQATGCKKVSYFPFAFDQDLFAYNDQVKDHTHNYIYDVSFIGTWEPKREHWLERLCLALPSIKLIIYGNEWEKQLKTDSPLRKYLYGQALYGQKMINIFKKTKINLNFIRRQNMQAHNMRTFEIPACGAFLLTQYTKDQASVLFKEGESISCFHSTQELIEKIKYYLICDKEREKIAHSGFIIAQNFTLEKTLKNFMDAL